MLRFTPDVTYPPAPLCFVYPCWREPLTLSVGGGFIESFAFGSLVSDTSVLFCFGEDFGLLFPGGEAPAPNAQRGGHVQVPRPEECFSLPEWLGG